MVIRGSPSAGCLVVPNRYQIGPRWPIREAVPGSVAAVPAGPLVSAERCGRWRLRASDRARAPGSAGADRSARWRGAGGSQRRRTTSTRRVRSRPHRGSAPFEPRPLCARPNQAEQVLPASCAAPLGHVYHGARRDWREEPQRRRSREVGCCFCVPCPQRWYLGGVAWNSRVALLGIGRISPIDVQILSIKRSLAQGFGGVVGRRVRDCGVPVAALPASERVAPWAIVVPSRFRLGSCTWRVA